MASGTVKWFNYKKRFGFIEPEEGGADVFVHISAVKASNIDRLEEDQKVEYDLEKASNGKDCAVNIKLTG